MSETLFAMPEAGAKMTTHDLLGALRGHYLKHGGIRQGDVFLTEVTAPDRVHRADAVHVGLWASRGYTVDVHELKVSRADFQRELDKPAKAEAWWPHSNTFWIVAPDATVAPPELLPPGWGLMIPGRSRRFKTVVKAEFRDLKPSTALLAALLVSMETDLGNALEKQQHALKDKYYRDLETVRRDAAMHGDPEARERLKHLDKLEEAIGFRLDSYDWDDRVSTDTLAAAIREAIVAKRATREIGRVLKSLDSYASDLKHEIAKARKELNGGGA